MQGSLIQFIFVCYFAFALGNSTFENGETFEAVLNEKNDLNVTEPAAVIITAASYSKIFKHRRGEHSFTVKKMLTYNYEKNYKLLKLTYEKIFHVIDVSNATLNNRLYTSAMGFPQTDHTLQEAVVLALENCCLAGEFLLHFPEMSYRIFTKSNFKNWKSSLNWCINFVNEYAHIIDEATVNLMHLLRQEINEEVRDSRYINPYYVHKTDSLTVMSSKNNKPRKKLKKGPQLSMKNEL